MREWLGKPLLMLAAILMVMGAFVLWWFGLGPARAGAADRSTSGYHKGDSSRLRTAASHQQQIQQAINELEKGP
jgi:hypothetical protein